MNVKIAVAIGLPAVVAATLLPILASVPAYAANVAANITIGAQSKTTDAYSPNPLKINVGDTITWTNKDSAPHTVTSGSSATPDGKFDSSPGFRQLLIPEGTFSHTFEEAGEYPYYCGLHANMVGTVIVAAGGDNGGTPQDTSITALIFPIIVAILAASIAAIIGYARFARKRTGSSGTP